MNTRWISMRRAAGLLAEIGINRESARQALHAGLAGPVTPTGAGHLVDEHLVRAVIERAQRSADDLDVVERLCRTGVFVGRLGPRAPTPDEAWRSWRGADITAPEHEQRAAAAGWWRMAIPTQVWLGVRARAEMLPFVGVVAGIAVVGGEVASVHGDPGRADPLRTRFELRPAGDWFEQLRGHRLGRPAGSPWFGWPDGIWAALDRIGR